MARPNKPSDIKSWSSTEEQRTIMENMVLATSKGAAVREARRIVIQSAQERSATPDLLKVIRKYLGEAGSSRVQIAYTLIDPLVLRSASYRVGTGADERIMVVLSDSLSPKLQAEALAAELQSQADDILDNDAAGAVDWLRRIQELFEGPTSELKLDAIINPKRKTDQGVLIESVSVAWRGIVDQLGINWQRAYEIPPNVWEEIIAGAYSLAGFDEVILTPRSGDFGRDVIAVRNGIGSIKIIGSVKAYKPGHLVGYDDVRALLGVMTGERNTSKGIITTTSAFPPNIARDPFIAAFMPYRLELMDGKMLQAWLRELVGKN